MLLHPLFLFLWVVYGGQWRTLENVTPFSSLHLVDLMELEVNDVHNYSRRNKTLRQRISTLLMWCSTSKILKLFPKVLTWWNWRYAAYTTTVKEESKEEDRRTSKHVSLKLPCHMFPRISSLLGFPSFKGEAGIPLCCWEYFLRGGVFPPLRPVSCFPVSFMSALSCLVINDSTVFMLGYPHWQPHPHSISSVPFRHGDGVTGWIAFTQKGSLLGEGIIKKCSLRSRALTKRRKCSVVLPRYLPKTDIGFRSHFRCNSHQSRRHWLMSSQSDFFGRLFWTSYHDAHWVHMLEMLFLGN